MRFGHDSTGIPDIRAAVMCRIGIDDFAPATREGHTDAVAPARHGREIEDRQDRRRIAKTPLPGIYALRCIITDNPAEALGVGVAMQRPLPRIEPVKIAYQALQTRMWMFMQQVPRHFTIMIPFVPLSDFAAHEQKL